MRNIISKVIMSFITLLMVIALFILGVLAYQELIQQNDEELSVAETNSELFFGENPKKENIDTPNLIESIVKIDDKSSSEQVNFDNVYVDNYYYNQLNNYSKTIYKALVENKENMKTGTYKVELGNSFDDLLNKENGGEILGQYYQSAIEAYTYDNVDVFYFDVNHMYLNIESISKGNKTKYNVFINSGNEASYLSSYFQSKEDVDRAIQQVEQEKNKILQNRTNNTYTNIKMVHDYLIANLEYDTGVSGNNIYNLYGGLVSKRCVCEGYAKSFKYLMDALNIPCTLVIGGATNSEGKQENHEWNYVQIGSNWYAIDCTWDDPIIRGSGYIDNSIKYKYFLKGSADFNRNHFPDGHFTSKGMEFVYPTISYYDFN